MSTDDVIAVEVTDEALILASRGGDFGQRASSLFRDAAVAAASEHSHLPVIVDLEGVAMMPSLGISVLVTLGQVSRQNGHRLHLAGLSDNVRSMLTMCRLDRLFDLHDTRDEALAAVGG